MANCKGIVWEEGGERQIIACSWECGEQDKKRCPYIEDVKKRLETISERD